MHHYTKRVPNGSVTCMQNVDNAFRECCKKWTVFGIIANIICDSAHMSYV